MYKTYQESYGKSSTSMGADVQQRNYFVLITIVSMYC